MDSKNKSIPKNKTTKEEFYKWAVKWFYSNIPENTGIRPDLPTLICLLQAIGFKLRKFDKYQENEQNENDSVDPENIKITLQCGSSNMSAILEMDSVKCQCFSYADTDEKDGSFWSIVGTEPLKSNESINKIDETGSNLLPEISKETNLAVRDIIYRVFKIIEKLPTDLDSSNNKNLKNSENFKKTDNKKSSLKKSYTDLFVSNNKKDSSSNRSFMKLKLKDLDKKSDDNKNVKLIRYNTFDKIDLNNESLPSSPSTSNNLLKNDNNLVDDNKNLSNLEPRTYSPSKLPNPSNYYNFLNTSSLINTSSDDSDNEFTGISDYVIKAHSILEKAIKVIIKKLPPSSSSIALHQIGNMKNEMIKPSGENPLNTSFIVSPRDRNSNLFNRSNISNVSGISGSSRQNSISSRSTTATTATTAALKRPIIRQSLATSIKSLKSPPVVQKIKTPSQNVNTITNRRRTVSSAGTSNPSSSLNASINNNKLINSNRSYSIGGVGDVKKFNYQSKGNVNTLLKTPGTLNNKSINSPSVVNKFGFQPVKK